MNNQLSSLQHFVAQNANNIIVLADKHTMRDCFPLLGSEVRHIQVPYGEIYKNLNSCEFIWKKLANFGATRKNILLCLGGGVICDMGAFAGACYQRGMHVILVPTSLLAMVDASTGGKTGVNFLHFKNYIGLFREADEVFICPDFLETLPSVEMTNGFVEMLKHGLIADAPHYHSVKKFFSEEDKALDYQLIFDSIAIKKRFVDQDFRDVGLRKRLNFGHTVGHALEAHSLLTNDENESLSHGTAVALGMVVESYISHQEAGLSGDELHQITQVLQPLIAQVKEEIPALDILMPYLLKDKKNENQNINFSLIKTIGESEHNREISVATIAAGLAYLQKLR